MYLIIYLLLTIIGSIKPAQQQSAAKLYTLHADGLIVPSYIVGPKEARSALNVNSAVLVKQLDRAQEEHQRLVALVDSKMLSDSEILSFKKQKLRAKDEVTRLLKQLSIRQSKPSLSPLLIELGAGGFGRVLFGHCVQSSEEVAVKVAPLEDAGNLWKENLILNRLRNCEGFTKVHFFGKQSVLDMGQHMVMVMSVLGPSLDKLMQHTTLGVRGFSYFTVLEVASQMIDRLKILSDFKIIHGDIQPGNMLMGRGNDDKVVHLIDFGLSMLSSVSVKDSKMFRGAFSDISDLHTNTSTPNMMSLRGTLSYSSINAMNGVRGSARDDLESLAYSLAYMLCNQLPWTQLINEHSNADNLDNLVQLVQDCKRGTSSESLCITTLRTTAVAHAVSAIHAHAKQLSPSEIPDFMLLKKIVTNAILVHQSECAIDKFDWTIEGINWSSDDGCPVQSW